MVQTKFFIQYNKPKIEIQQIFSYIMLKLFGNLQNLNVYVNCLFDDLKGNKNTGGDGYKCYALEKKKRILKKN